MAMYKPQTSEKTKGSVSHSRYLYTARTNFRPRRREKRACRRRRRRRPRDSSAMIRAGKRSREPGARAHKVTHGFHLRAIPSTEKLHQVAGLPASRNGRDLP